MEKAWYPLIVFSFSRADCEAHAVAVQQLNFNTDEEQEQVELCFKNAVAVLPEEARRDARSSSPPCRSMRSGGEKAAPGTASDCSRALD